MSLLDLHDEVLKISLEDPDFFGIPITFFDNEGVERYSMNGQVNSISQHLGTEADGVKAERDNCTVRFTTLAENCGFPSNLEWNDNLPAEGWTITTVKTALKIPCAFALELGGDFPDYHLPLVTYFLTKLEIEQG